VRHPALTFGAFVLFLLTIPPVVASFDISTTSAFISAAIAKVLSEG
jgi:hypothetical protein